MSLWRLKIFRELDTSSKYLFKYKNLAITQSIIQMSILREKCPYSEFFSGPHFPSFGVSLRIQSECGKIRTRKTPNKDASHAVEFNQWTFYLKNKGDIPVKILYRNFDIIATVLIECFNQNIKNSTLSKELKTSTSLQHIVKRP